MSKYYIIILLINHLQLFHHLAFALEHNQCSKNYYTEICIPSDYDKNIRPKINEENLIIVNFGQLEILQVDDRQYTINLNFNLFLAWFDSRAEFTCVFNKSAIDQWIC